MIRVLRLIDSLLQEKFLRTNRISTSLLRKIKYGQLYFHLVENIQCIHLYIFSISFKKNWRKFLCSESIYLLQFVIVLSITHKVNIHLQPNFRRLIFKISYEIYLSVCKIIKWSEGPNRKSHLGGRGVKKPDKLRKFVMEEWLAVWRMTKPRPLLQNSLHRTPFIDVPLDLKTLSNVCLSPVSPL